MRFDALASSLARTADARTASWAVVEHLAGPGLRPSVYLERGGRLRCQALLGYRQLLDGIPPWTGIIGRTYASGRRSVVRDVRQDPGCLRMSDGVVAEACVPISCWERTVGAINLELSQPLSDGDLEQLEAAAVQLGAKIEALGGLMPESASQRLVRHSITLATQFDTAAIERAVLAAAVDLTPLTSAMVVRREPDGGRFELGRAQGPLEEVLAATSADAIASLAAFTSVGCSAYTVSGAGSRPGAGENAGIEALRAAGARSVAVLPVGPDRLLVVAGATSTGLSTEHCELLELLAAQATACLRTAASVSELRTRATTDALTGLGHHASFHTELAEAREAGDVGVLIIDVDAFKGYNDRHGHPGGDRALRAVAASLTTGLRRGDVLFRIGGDEFAAVLPGVDDDAAMEVAHRLHHEVAGSAAGVSVSIGAAAARPGENAKSVLARADRALYTVKEHGRNGVALSEVDQRERRTAV